MRHLVSIAAFLPLLAAPAACRTRVATGDAKALAEDGQDEAQTEAEVVKSPCALSRDPSREVIYRCEMTASFKHIDGEPAGNGGALNVSSRSRASTAPPPGFRTSIGRRSRSR
jgi:hypothetical protein